MVLDAPPVIDDLFKKYSLFWWSEELGEEEKLHLVIELPRHSLVSDATNEFLKYINEYLEDKEFDFKLSTNIDYYSIRFAKKKGTPKYDYPGTFKFTNRSCGDGQKYI